VELAIHEASHRFSTIRIDAHEQVRAIRMLFVMREWLALEKSATR